MVLQLSCGRVTVVAGSKLGCRRWVVGWWSCGLSVCGVVDLGPLGGMSLVGWVSGGSMAEEQWSAAAAGVSGSCLLCRLQWLK